MARRVNARLKTHWLRQRNLSFDQITNDVEYRTVEFLDPRCLVARNDDRDARRLGDQTSVTTSE